MLDILGTIGGSILSLPGILGLALGMMTRNVLLGAILGVLVGIAESAIFAKFSIANIETFELIVAMLVGLAAGALGSLIRIKGTMSEPALSA